MSKKTKISIAVTDLAPLCGMDYYDNWCKIICKIWKKYNKEDFNKCESELRSLGHIALACDSTQKKLADLEAKYGKHGTLTGVVKQINSVKTKSSSTLVSAQNTVISSLDTAMGPTLESVDKELLTSLIKSATNTMHGVFHEGNGLDLFTKVSGLAVTDTQVNVNIVFHEDDKYIWEINGRLDGITENGRLVEIKNRQKALFNTVRDYEMCQIQTYLYHKNMDLGYLMEVLPGSQGAKYNILEVVTDSEYFKRRIQPWLTRIVKFVTNTLFVDTNLRENILKGDKDKFAYMCYSIIDIDN